MKNSRKLILLGALLFSSTLGAVGNYNNSDNLPPDRGTHAGYVVGAHKNEGWIITEFNEKAVLFDAKEINYHVGITRDNNYGHDMTQYYSGIGADTASFVAKHDNKKYNIDNKTEYYVFEHSYKPTTEYYDVEYGSNEWYDLLETVSNYAENNNADMSF